MSKPCDCNHYENHVCYAPIPGWVWNRQEINICKSYDLDPEHCTDCDAFEPKKGDL